MPVKNIYIHFLTFKLRVPASKGLWFLVVICEHTKLKQKKRVDIERYGRSK